jgi:hypothetical protein
VFFISFETLGTNKVLSLAVFDQIEPINSNWGVSFHSILVTITQIEIRFKTKVSHKHMVVIYQWNTPLPKVRKGLDRYRWTRCFAGSANSWVFSGEFGGAGSFRPHAHIYIAASPHRSRKPVMRSGQAGYVLTTRPACIASCAVSDAVLHEPFDRSSLITGHQVLATHVPKVCVY